ncbi:TauD/TfdA family dioxygenase [Kibdelosporangium persicum]|uniref:Alpha-ketoglutarate-dependent taurine dioxygenase n=1 Tax=Kibdelosporangium persicum TaxID=2698649 RepID=A0ABX2F4Z5_9PSEU|nr:TauD/TfdA family dioxygenase [Kibdelosporangium persicum]NRN66409.1 Alpha-ketoglutarate-dependent taurine dioxygenase [Kibdelosporangium persicum]
MNSNRISILPTRVDVTDADKARQALAENGAVILTGLPTTPDGLVIAAAHLYGQHIRQIFPLRERRSHDGNPVRLHADSFDQVVDIGGALTRRRDPDEDAVLIQCVDPPRSGGDSFLADAYRFIDTYADADLVDFLTGTDVDLYGAWAGLRGLPAAPRVARHVEYTRTGRRIVRRTEGVVPLHRDPDIERINVMLTRFKHTVDELERELIRFTMDEGDILALDNYRCWHGRDAHTGDRMVRILTLLTAAAR